MAHVIAIANQKGGVGKTATALSLGDALAERGKRVLMVDIDSQGSLGVGSGLDVAHMDASMYNVIVEGMPIQTIVQTLSSGVDIAPANIFLSVADQQLATAFRREDRLKNALAPVRRDYDFILIDCPPSPGLLTVNALSAADYVLIPMACDYHSMVGLTLMLDTIQRIQGELNPNLRVLGVLATRYDGRTIHAREVLESTRSDLNGMVRVFTPVIPETVRMKESPIRGESILKIFPDNKAAEAYRSLAEEVIAYV